jgi:hypothetical protein
MKVITIGLVAVGFALQSSTFAVAKSVRHKPSVSNRYALQRAVIPVVGSRPLYPNYGTYGGASGGTLSNGRSASEAGGG